MAQFYSNNSDAEGRFSSKAFLCWWGRLVFDAIREPMKPEPPASPDEARRQVGFHVKDYAK
jgi:hypothetical protein